MYVLHYSPDSASTIVRMVLNELGLDHRCQLIDREGGELDSPAYRAMQPLGLFPAFQTPDGPMFETAAILLYLSDRHPGLAPAVGDPDRAAFLKWFFFTSFNIHPTLLQLFYPDRVAGAAAVDAVQAHAREHMATYLGILEAAAAANPAYLSADRPTLLGYYIAVQMRWLGSLAPDHPGHFDVRDYPALHKVLAMLEARPAAMTVAAAEELGATIFTNPG